MRPPVDNPTSERKVLQPDYYEAIIVESVYLGNIPNRFSASTQPTLYLGFEIVGEKNERGYPIIIRQDYNYVVSDRSHLYKLCEKWLIKNKGKENEEPWSLERARKFDPAKLVGHGLRVRLNITENKGWNNIAGAVPSKIEGKGVTESKKLIFDIDNPDKQMYDRLPKWMKDKVNSAKEWEEAAGKMQITLIVESPSVNITPEIQKEFGAEANPTPEQQKIIDASSSVEEDDLPF